MEQLFGIAKAHERRRARGGLRHIVDLQPPALIAGRLHPRRGARQQIVQRAGGDAHCILRVRKADQLEQAADALAGFGRDKKDGRIGHKAEILLKLFPEFIHRFIIFF